MPSPEIEAVTLKTLPEFAEFLHLHLQSERTPEVWFDGLRQHWLPVQTNYGFFLRKAGKVVGGIGAYYFDREIRGKYERFCNITSWCVLDSFRQHSMRLVLVLLSQPNLNFTDFSPTDVVGRTLRFLNFKEMDERVAVILNLPSWSNRDIDVLDVPDEIEASLNGDALKVYKDHACYPWLKHILLGRHGQWCHVIYKRQSFKGLPAAKVLYLNDPKIFSEKYPCLSAYLLSRGMVSTHVECRFIKKVPGCFSVRSGFNRKLYLSATLGGDDIDYLYSETMTLDL